MQQAQAQDELITSIVDLDEDAVREIVKRRISCGDDPLQIIDDCQQGMRLVGERYERGYYFIAGLIMAGEIFRQVMLLIQPQLQRRPSSRPTGCVLLGTVQEDIHDLGKNIFNMLLTCHGFTVHDLGVDVTASKFLENVQQIQPDIIGLSGLLTGSYNRMKETIALLKKETQNWSKPMWIIVGGGQVNEQVAQLVGTEYWSNDAIEGVRLCQRLLK